MDILFLISLDYNSLLVFNILPLAYFAYHRRYWYRPDSLRNFDILLRIICLILVLFIMARIGVSKSFERDWMILLLLHMLPPALTLIIISWFSVVRREIQKGLPAQGKPRADIDTGFSPAPQNLHVEKLSWKDLIIEESLKDELQSVINLLKDPTAAEKYGVQVPRGILLEGPPGTGKTTVAKVMANTAGLSFFSLRMDEVISKWVGESEKNLSLLFHTAQRHAPAVIFIDEVDSLGHGRSMNGQQWADNFLNHMLQLIDGVIRTNGIYIIGATNRADLIDPALRRSGRLNRTIHVPLPGFESRVKLFSLHLSKLKLERDVDLNLLSTLTEGKSGADIKEICNRAGINAFKRESGGSRRDYTVRRGDLEAALRDFMTP